MMESSDPHQFENILNYLRHTRGVDFTAYKRASLMRRVARRLQVLGLDSYEAYFAHLQVHQDELPILFDTLLINVTGFFRDDDVWDYLATTALPQMLAARGRDEPFRVWSAGCSSGQEAYSVLMLLAERLGAEAVCDHVKIYATDADEQALNEARTGIYDEAAVAGIPAELLGKYFAPTKGGYLFRRDLRRAVTFGRHDLVQDAPISRVDLLLCRNTLMYFNADTQARILAGFFRSLNSGGHILLGRAEMHFGDSTMFAPVDLRRRLFRAVSRPSHRDVRPLSGDTGRDIQNENDSTFRQLRECVFETDRIPQILVDRAGVLVAANASARSALTLTARDIGRPVRDMEVSVPPANLRARITRAVGERTEVSSGDMTWTVGGEPRLVDVVVAPLFGDDQAVVGTAVRYVDVTDLRLLQNELRASKQALETAYEELQSTNEELETTNEELQSAVEELETTNEQLQSTNEELETVNGDLQTKNDGLQTMNDEWRTRADRTLGDGFLESILTSLHSAAIVVDQDLRIQVWNPLSTDLWGLRSEEVLGTDFLGLDIGLPVAELRHPIRAVLDGGDERSELRIKAVNRRGTSILCRVSIAALRHRGRSPNGAILLMEDQPPQAV